MHKDERTYLRYMRQELSEAFGAATGTMALLYEPYDQGLDADHPPHGARWTSSVALTALLTAADLLTVADEVRHEIEEMLEAEDHALTAGEREGIATASDLLGAAAGAVDADAVSMVLRKTHHQAFLGTDPVDGAEAWLRARWRKVVSLTRLAWYHLFRASLKPRVKAYQAAGADLQALIEQADADAVRTQHFYEVYVPDDDPSCHHELVYVAIPMPRQPPPTVRQVEFVEPTTQHLSELRRLLPDATASHPLVRLRAELGALGVRVPAPRTRSEHLGDYPADVQALGWLWR